MKDESFVHAALMMMAQLRVHRNGNVSHAAWKDSGESPEDKLDESTHLNVEHMLETHTIA